MSTPLKPKRALALLSGGLDSALAARMIKDQGVEVIGLHLASPFGCLTEVKKVADSLGIELLTKDKGAAYLDLVKNPKYGYGRAMNPCIDCRIFMFELAEPILEELGGECIVTGEVLGQRPMSQHRSAMELIERKSPLADRVVRPLSAHLFPPSLPEREGWIDRSKLLGISGRARKEQFALAESLGIHVYAPPGGGCMLTETSFSQKLKDFYEHESATADGARLAQAEFLRIGRHFRLDAETKVIVSRNQEENAFIEGKWKDTQGTLFYPADFTGPHALALGPLTPEKRSTVGALIRRYGKVAEANEAKVGYESDSGSGVFFANQPLQEEALGALRI